MKRTLIIGLTILALAPLAGAEDQPSRKAKKKQAKQETAATTTNVKAHPVRQTNVNNAKVNPYYKKLNNRPGDSGNYTHVNRKGTRIVNQNNRTIVNNNNIKTGKVGKHRFVVTGNAVSFSDARRFNWHQRHDRNWWRSSGFRLLLYGGGYYYWNNGWWYPAYGYDPYYSNYVYDGPIYGYGYTNPGDVTSEVQRALSQQGYYNGPVDGILGPMTRRAITRFQIDRGLAVTEVIDQQTLVSLGLA